MEEKKKFGPISLSELWKATQSGFWSAKKLQQKFGITQAQANKLLAGQESVQRTKRVLKTVYPPAGTAPGTYAADLLFLDKAYKKKNHGYSAILTLINLNTRKAYAEPIKTKADTAVALEKILSEMKMGTQLI